MKSTAGRGKGLRSAFFCQFIGKIMLKLLLIDDDEELCMELTQVLTAEGFEVDVVFDGLAGFAFIAREAISNGHFRFEIARAKWIRSP